VSHELTKLVVAAAALYLGVGAVFAVPFALRWSGKLDPAAGSGSTGFRLLILPGAALLWPLLLLRLRRAR
jgi:hypothetical protein